MRHLRSLLAELLLVAIPAMTLGCSPYAMPIGRRPLPASSTICAFGVPGVRTSVRDTEGGVNVTFVVVGDVTELRQRAHAALAGTYPLRPESRAIANRVHATIRDEQDGLVLHAVPIDPADLAWVRDAVRRLISDVLSNGCD